jgi:hypothetical protein
MGSWIMTGAETNLDGSVTDVALMVTMVLEAGFGGAVYIVEISLPDGLRLNVPHSDKLHDAVQSTNGIEEGSFAICALNEIEVPGLIEAGGEVP